MTAFISIAINSRVNLNSEVLAIQESLIALEINSLVFVDAYVFKPNEERLMMKKVMSEISKCDFLIAETSDNGIALGVEIGYAKAKNKRVIYLRHLDAERSKAVSGISDFEIIYGSCDDLKIKLMEVARGLRFSSSRNIS